MKGLFGYVLYVVLGCGVLMGAIQDRDIGEVQDGDGGWTVMSQRTQRIAVGLTDDAAYNTFSGVWDNSAATITIGFKAAPDAFSDWAILRFPMTLLPDVKLVAVSVSFTAVQNDDGALAAQIDGMDVTDAPSFVTDQSGTAVTGVPVGWFLGPWTAEAKHDSSDLATLLRAYLDRGDYDPGEGFYWGLVFRGFGIIGADSRVFYARDHTSGATKAPVLNITYTLGDQFERIQIPATLGTQVNIDATVGTQVNIEAQL